MHSKVLAEILVEQRTWYQEHDCISYLKGQSGEVVEPVLKGTLSDSIPYSSHTGSTGSMNNSLIQVRGFQINSNRMHTAHRLTQKLVSQRYSYSQSSPGPAVLWSSFQPAQRDSLLCLLLKEKEEGLCDWKTKRNEDNQTNARLLTPVLTIKQKRFDFSEFLAWHFLFISK